MSKENETNKWLDAQLHPELYTDEELDHLLAEQAGDEMSLLKRALTSKEAKNNLNIEEEWKKWEESHAASSSLEETSLSSKRNALWQHAWLKIAAAFVGLIMLSGFAYAAYYVISPRETNQQLAAADSLQQDSSKGQKTATTQTWQKIEPSKDAPVIFEDAELRTILNYISEKAKVKVEYRNAASAHIRFYLQWESQDTLGDIIDKINHFQKVHIIFDESTQCLTVD